MQQRLAGRRQGKTNEPGIHLFLARFGFCLFLINEDGSYLSKKKNTAERSREKIKAKSYDPTIPSGKATHCQLHRTVSADGFTKTSIQIACVRVSAFVYMFVVCMYVHACTGCLHVFMAGS